MKIKFEIIKNSSLREHEMVSRVHLKELIKEIARDGYISDPIIVDKNTKIILDGHHRFNAIKFLGLALAPVYLCRL
jgi:ParB-like chromosome segregation protein Spo0J